MNIRLFLLAICVLFSVLLHAQPKEGIRRQRGDYSESQNEKSGSESEPEPEVVLITPPNNAAAHRRQRINAAAAGPAVAAAAAAAGPAVAAAAAAAATSPLRRLPESLYRGPEMDSQNSASENTGSPERFVPTLEVGEEPADQTLNVIGADGTCSTGSVSQSILNKTQKCLGTQIPGSE